MRSHTLFVATLILGAAFRTATCQVTHIYQSTVGGMVDGDISRRSPTWKTRVSRLGAQLF